MTQSSRVSDSAAFVSLDLMDWTASARFWVYFEITLGRLTRKSRIAIIDSFRKRVQGKTAKEKEMEEYTLEQLRSGLERTEKETDRRLSQYYVSLAEEPEGENTDQLYEEVNGEIRELKATSVQLREAYQKMSASADELETRLHEVQASRKKRILISAPPANSVIDLEEQKAKHFAQGINFYKIFLICFIGSFVGVVLEMLWCLITNGYIESRAGLVYGPLNLLYGAGAVALTLALYKYRNRSGWISFIGGMIVGSVVEYICSWGQELVFGSRSWDYSHMPFNLNGRICLLYSILWGVLGLLWIKNIYPRMAKWILKIPNQTGKIVTWVLVVFMVFNSVVTMVTMTRWTQRIKGHEASNGFERLIDERFPNERMEKIFANMEFD